MEDSLTNPKWCVKVDNPETAEEYYTKDEISEFVKEEIGNRKLIEFIRHARSNDIIWY